MNEIDICPFDSGLLHHLMICSASLLPFSCFAYYIALTK